MEVGSKRFQIGEEDIRMGRTVEEVTAENTALVEDLALGDLSLKSKKEITQKLRLSDTTVRRIV